MIETWKQWEGQTADGRFRLGRYLGASARGPVFLTEFGEGEAQRAAIKLIAADSQHAEAQLAQWTAAAHLAHPHLLRVLQSGRCEVGEARMVYVVSEFADEDLSQVVPQRGLSAAETGEMLRPALEALAYLHGKGLAHGHIKPANIMAVGEQVKISSDGICAARQTNGRGAMATPYDAPEAGTRGCSAAGDVWSLGVTLVEVLTQQLPTWEWKGQEEPQLPKALPAPFGDIVRQCLRRDPQRRSTLAEIATRLDPDAAPLGKLNTAEHGGERVAEQRVSEARVAKHSAAQAPKPAAAGRSGLAGGARAAGKAQSPAARQHWAVPAIAIAVVALLVIFAAPKIFNRNSPQASPEPAASLPEQPEAQPEARPRPPAGDQPAAKPSASRLDTAGGAPAMAAAQPKPAAKSAASGVVGGEVAHQVLPEVPQKARETISGKVRVGVRLEVDASGRVASADLESAGPSKYFANLAVKAARQWEFRPAKVDGQEAPSEWVLRFEFGQDGTKVTPVMERRN